jgi:hypothetical protein
MHCDAYGDALHTVMADIPVKAVDLRLSFCNLSDAHKNFYNDRA